MDNDDEKSTKKSEKDAFDEFQLEEYKNISNAHFESIKQISVFFRYYLLILAAPIIILNFVSDKEDGIETFLQGHSLSIYYDIVFFYFLIVSLIGLSLFLYVVNLRFDAVLYARAVNKVRKYFYEKSDLTIEQYESYLQLPIVSTKPKYSEKTFVLPLLFVFVITNCSFLCAGFILKLKSSVYFGEWPLPFDFPLTTFVTIVAVISFGLIHIIGYLTMIYLRNNYYLKSYSMGIDIDGVINEQTSHFVEWLAKLTGKEIKSEDIKEYPVHLNASLCVKDSDEKLVFNTREYWEKLPEKIGAVKRIEDFHKRFGYNILLFSYRDWPQYGKNEKEINGEKDQIKSKGYTPMEIGDLKKITKSWLKEKGIEPFFIEGFWSALFFSIFSNFINKKRITIELGNPYISDTRFWVHFRKAILTRNRFQGANLRNLRFFIEDHPENAIKLSNLCEYVFMFDEPYNRDSKYRFPKNVIRVTTWDDIYRHMKLLS